MRHLIPTGIPVFPKKAGTCPLRSARVAELWVVDPIDGTKEFIKRNGEFTVNIALVRRRGALYWASYMSRLRASCMSVQQGRRRQGHAPLEIAVMLQQ